VTEERRRDPRWARNHACNARTNGLFCPRGLNMPKIRMASLRDACAPLLKSPAIGYGVRRHADNRCATLKRGPGTRQDGEIGKWPGAEAQDLYAGRCGMNGSVEMIYEEEAQARVCCC